MKNITPTKQGLKAGIDGRVYARIHYWLRTKYGKASKCTDKDCSGNSHCYGWALIKGNEYDFKRENFTELCKSCHSRYDIKEDTADRRFKTLKSRVYKVRCVDCDAQLESVMNKPKRCNECWPKFMRKYREDNKERININAMKSYYRRKALLNQELK